MSKDETNPAGLRVVFWTWMGLIIVGLTIMIAIPLTGR